ncbi:MAG: TetR/AcrR family transcriptional regulator [candidate division FCPU426 bacterium]
MARPSANTDEKLLKAGREVIAEHGLSGLSMRAVAKKAGVNLGMFHYHFKNKAEFSRRCTEEAYAEFFRGFELETADGSTLQRLRRGLLALARFSRDQRFFILALLRDLEAKSPEAWEFLRRRFPPPHAKVIIALIKQGQKEGLVLKAPLGTLMPVLMSGILFPNLIGGMAEKAVGTRFMRLPRLGIQRLFLSDKALAARVDLALRGLLIDPKQDQRRTQ